MDSNSNAVQAPQSSAVAVRVKSKRNTMLHLLRQNGGNVAAACRALGVARQTYYNWKAKYPRWRDKVEEIENELTDNVESAIYREALTGNMTAAVRWMEAKGGWNRDGNPLAQDGTKLMRPMNQKEIRERIRTLLSATGRTGDPLPPVPQTGRGSDPTGTAGTD